MDISIILGFLTIFMVLDKSIGLEMFFELFYQPASLILVLGGTIAAAFIHFPITQTLLIPRLIFVIFSMRRSDLVKDIGFLVDIAEKINDKGRTSIIDEVDKSKDFFIKMGLQLVIDNLSTEALEKVLKDNIQHISKRHYIGIQMFQNLGKYAPAFGLFGTVVGLIRLLSNMTNPEAIGPGMAMALITTFYGIALSNFIFLPIAGRLESYNYEEALQKEMLTVGILAISDSESSFVVREKMMLFLDKKQRDKQEKHREKLRAKD